MVPIYSIFKLRRLIRMRRHLDPWSMRFRGAYREPGNEKAAQAMIVVDSS